MKLTQQDRRAIGELIRARAYEAFDAALQEATEEGLRDLQVALETGVFESVEGRARLIQVPGSWGSVAGTAPPQEPGVVRFPSACVLTVLFHRQARRLGGGARATAWLSEMAMRKHGFRARDFYGAWDNGLLDAGILLERLNRYISIWIAEPA